MTVFDVDYCVRRPLAHLPAAITEYGVFKSFPSPTTLLLSCRTRQRYALLGRGRQIPAVEMSPQSSSQRSQSGKLHAMHAAFLFKQNLKKQASPASEATFTNFATARSMARSLPPTLGSLAARILPILPPRPPDTWDFVNAFAEMPKPRCGMSWDLERARILFATMLKSSKVVIHH